MRAQLETGKRLGPPKTQPHSNATGAGGMSFPFTRWTDQYTHDPWSTDQW